MEQNLQNNCIDICVIGCNDVGVTSFCKREASNSITKDFCKVGVDFYTKWYLIDRKYLEIRIWDISWSKFFYSHPFWGKTNKTHFIVMYDVTNRDTFQTAIIIVEKLKEINKTRTILLVGNKIDKNDKQVTFQEALSEGKGFLV
ncbi:Small GTP-binding protein [Entamoeba marina]